MARSTHSFWIIAGQPIKLCTQSPAVIMHWTFLDLFFTIRIVFFTIVTITHQPSEVNSCTGSEQRAWHRDQSQVLLLPSRDFWVRLVTLDFDINNNPHPYQPCWILNQEVDTLGTVNLRFYPSRIDHNRWGFSNREVPIKSLLLTSLITEHLPGAGISPPTSWCFNPCHEMSSTEASSSLVKTFKSEQNLWFWVQNSLYLYK